jgi:hypothetical protein
MKIEKRGLVAAPENREVTPPWWLGKKAECSKCGCLITLEIGDAPGHYTTFAVKCPTPKCGVYIPIRPMFDRAGKIG